LLIILHTFQYIGISESAADCLLTVRAGLALQYHQHLCGILDIRFHHSFLALHMRCNTLRYQRVRQLLSDMGLALPDTPKPQPTAAASFSADAAAAATAGAAATAAANSGSSELDPEKLRAVFEALLSNPASRTLMRKLLAGAGMPFDEVAFEEQIKDATYFNLAIAPILRKMPPQKLAVLADLQVRPRCHRAVRMA
jgi:hypothetical protein